VKREGLGLRGLLPVAPARVAALSLFPYAGLGRSGARVRVSGGEQREGDGEGSQGSRGRGSGNWEIEKIKPPPTSFISFFLY